MFIHYMGVKPMRNFVKEFLADTTDEAFRLGKEKREVRIRTFKLMFIFLEYFYFHSRQLIEKPNTTSGSK